jgi:methylmalonyl-CoA mutase cobalamin-binding subunit
MDRSASRDRPDASPPPADAIDPGATVSSDVDAARAFDVQAMERLLDDAFAARRFVRAMDVVVFPTLRAHGAAWGDEDLDVAQEHVASEAIRRRLARFYDVAARGGSPGPIVVGMPPAGQHELGALSFAVAARRAGLDSLYLGANVPLESWLRTMRETGGRIAVLGVVTRADATDAARVVERLRALPTPPLCLIGGPARHDVPPGPGIVHLPEDTDEAVALTVALAVDGIPTP